jgi:hypothetical protein
VAAYPNSKMDRSIELQASVYNTLTGVVPPCSSTIYPKGEGCHINLKVEPVEYTPPLCTRDAKRPAGHIPRRARLRRPYRRRSFYYVRVSIGAAALFARGRVRCTMHATSCLRSRHLPPPALAPPAALQEGRVVVCAATVCRSRGTLPALCPLQR